MSEANSPENDQNLSEPASSPTPWYADWTNFSVDDAGNLNPVAESEPSQEEEWQDWQTVDFPNAISADAIERQALYAEDREDQKDRGDRKPISWTLSAAPTPSVASSGAPAVGASSVSASSDESAEQPSMAELISLIQELNQCNSALIDRVSYLEEALDRSETALQVEIGRSQEQSVSAPQELIVAQEQIAHLTNQVEFANQTNQRQQIMIETLTAQLENSQERVAQLERECALTQQRYNEQSHLLNQQENACRDLHIRLQRQQRYTLQFKAALDKCLEVPSPVYEAYGEARNIVTAFQPWAETRGNLTPQPFLPKVQRIKPWSSDAQPLASKLEALVNHPNGLQLVEANTIQSIKEAIVDADSTASETPQLPTAANPEPISTATSLKDVDPQFLAIAAQSLTDLSPEAIRAGLEELQSVLGDLWEGQPSGETSTEVAGEAETDLWQDLTRLIDVSADDVSKVSTAQDFASFEAAHSEAANVRPVVAPVDEAAHSEAANVRPVSPSKLDAAEPKALEASKALEPSKKISAALPKAAAQTNRELRLPMPAIAQKQSDQQKQKQPEQSQSTSQGLPSVLLAQSGSPSPIVYPLRPQKKLNSLAAVDLPTFPRKEATTS